MPHSGKKTPYQGYNRCVGTFWCFECNAEWISDHSFRNRYQNCPLCGLALYPRSQKPPLNSCKVNCPTCMYWKQISGRRRKKDNEALQVNEDEGEEEEVKKSS